MIVTIENGDLYIKKYIPDINISISELLYSNLGAIPNKIIFNGIIFFRNEFKDTILADIVCDKEIIMHILEIPEQNNFTENVIYIFAFLSWIFSLSRCSDIALPVFFDSFSLSFVTSCIIWVINKQIENINVTDNILKTENIRTYKD